MAAARAKFFSECGVSLDDVGGIVIDEVSFITAAVFGHVDHVLRVRRPKTPMQERSCPPVLTHVLPSHPCRQAMTGNLDVPCGGVPILLCGDNHQK